MKEYRLYAGAYTETLRKRCGRLKSRGLILRSKRRRAESKRGSGGRVAKFRGIL